MKLIFAADWKKRPRILLEVDAELAKKIEDYLGAPAPWVVVDGQPVDGKVVLKVEENDG